MTPGHKRLPRGKILEVQSALHGMPESTIRHIHREWTCAVSNHRIPFPPVTHSASHTYKTAENIKLFKEVAMLTHKRRCGSKRALSAICDERGFHIGPTACRERKRLYTVQHCRRLQYKISEHHIIMRMKWCCDKVVQHRRCRLHAFTSTVHFLERVNEHYSWLTDVPLPEEITIGNKQHIRKAMFLVVLAQRRDDINFNGLIGVYPFMTPHTLLSGPRKGQVEWRSQNIDGKAYINVMLNQVLPSLSLSIRCKGCRDNSSLSSRMVPKRIVLRLRMRICWLR